MKHLIDGGNRLPYNPKLKDRARDMRKNMTEPEKKLWYSFLRELSQKNPSSDSVLGASFPLGGGGLRGSVGMRIYRQRPIDNFIVDFYIPSYKLVIEIDGESHYEDGALEYDEERTEILKGLGLKVLRYTNHEVMNNFDGVCEDILCKLK